MLNSKDITNLILMLCFHLVKCTPFLSLPTLSKDQKIAKKKQAKLPPRHDPIVTRSCVREMSTSGTSPHEETIQEVALLKEKLSELMRMMQQLIVGGGLNSFRHSQGGPQTENENQPPPIQDQGHNVPPQGNDQETDPSKDKNPESRYGQVKSQVETLA